MIQKIREKIERRIKELKSHFPKGLDYHSYRVEELESLLSFIDTLEKHVDFEGLDEAARKYSYGRYATWVASDAFKAGAEWARRKMCGDEAE